MSSIATVESQARDWLGLVSAQEYETFSNKTYGGESLIPRRRCDGVSKASGTLRDWTTLNFLGGIHWGYFFPSGVLEQDFYLERYGLTIPAVVSRRAAGVSESLTRSFAHLKELSVDDFGSAYLAYAQAVSSFPVVHFEEFCEAPVPTFRRLCETLNCSF